MTFQRIAVLSLAMVLAAPAARLSAQTSRKDQSGCLTVGRRSSCTFVLRFDARLERFTQIEAMSDGERLRDTVPWPPTAGRRLPIYAGDMIGVSVANLPWSERVAAAGTSTEASPYPRPGLDSADRLSSLQLSAFVRQFLSGVRGELEASQENRDVAQGNKVSAVNFRSDPAEFQRQWKRLMLPLPLNTPELEERTDSIAAKVNGTLTLWAELLHTASMSIVPRLERMAEADSAQAATIASACARDGEENCLDALLEASSLAERQRSFQAALAVLLDAAHMEAALAAADSVARLLGTPAVRGILARDLEPVLKELDEMQSSEADLGELEVRTQVRLRDNVKTAWNDHDDLQRYVALRRKLETIRDDTKAALATIQAFRAKYEAARLRLAIAAAELAMSFDIGATSRDREQFFPVLRPVGDKEVRVTLTRSPRFAPLSPALTLPSAITNAAAPPNAGKTAADGAAPSPGQAPGTRTYSATLTARDRHVFQVIAGFSLTSIKSVAYGTRDELTTGDGRLRRIAVANHEWRRVVPSIQLVWHDHGKDLDPDAYENGWYVPGIALGTTLDRPMKDFLAGVALEPARGIHLTAGWLMLRVQRLQEGFTVGSVIPSDAEPPLTDHLAGGWYVGGMLDLRVFVDFFANLL